MMRWRSYLLLITLLIAAASQIVWPSNILTNIFTSLTVTGLSAGQVVFPNASKTLAGDSNLTWDNTGKTLFAGPSSGYFPNAGTVLNGRVVNPSGSAIGAQGLAEDTGTQTIWGGSFAVASRNTAGTRVAGYGLEAHQELNGVGGTTTTLTSLFATTSFQNGTVVTSNGLQVQTPIKTGGTITTRNGILVENQTGGSTNYAIATKGGTVGFIGNLSFEIALNNATRGIYWNADGDCSTGCLYRDAVQGNLVVTPQANLLINGATNAVSYATATNCSSAASPAVCGSAAAGSFVIAAATTSVVVNTTDVTANSQIILTEDSSLGTKLGVTCNTQSLLVLGTPKVTARVAATSFTAAIEVGPTTNPMCVSYQVVN